MTTNGINGTLVGKAGEEIFIKCNVRRGVPENETKISLYYNEEIAKESLTGMLIYSFVPKGVNNGDTLKCVVRNLLLDAPLEEPIRLNITGQSPMHEVLRQTYIHLGTVFQLDKY